MRSVRFPGFNPLFGKIQLKSFNNAGAYFSNCYRAAMILDGEHLEKYKALLNGQSSPVNFVAEISTTEQLQHIAISPANKPDGQWERVDLLVDKRLRVQKKQQLMDLLQEVKTDLENSPPPADEQPFLSDYRTRALGHLGRMIQELRKNPLNRNYQV